MAKAVPFFLPSSQQDQRAIDRQMMMAQMLMSQQAPQLQPTRIVPRQSWVSALAPALSQVVGAQMFKKAQEGEDALKQKEYAAILEAMGGGGQPNQMSTVSGIGDGAPNAQPRTVMGMTVPPLPSTTPQPSPMNPYGLDPSIAAHAYMTDPAKYMGEVLSANKPTDFERDLQGSGFTPEQRQQAYAHKLLPTPEKATDDVREYEYAKQHGYTGSFEQWQMMKRQPSAVVNVNTEKSLYGTMADKVAGQYADLHAMAQNAPETIARARRVTELLDQVPYTGAAADWKLAMGKAAKAAGFDYAGDDIQNTELLARELGQNVLDNVKASGLAGSQGLTEGERKFLLQVVGGDITLDDKTLRRVAFLNERTARNAARKWNDTYRRLDPNQMRTMGLMPVDLPEPETPAARGGLPKAGDVQDGYEFMGGDPANPRNWRKK